MLRFKQTARVSATEALKSPYFAGVAESANDSSQYSLTSSETDNVSDEFDQDDVLPSADV